MVVSLEKAKSLLNPDELVLFTEFGEVTSSYCGESIFRLLSSGEVKIIYIS